MKPRAELPPCPFCESIHLDYHVLKKLDGSKVGMLRYYDSHCVCCMMCGARIEAGSEAEVIAKWKHRATEDALNAEVDRLARWVSDLQRGVYVNCVYCGHRYGPGETTLVSMADALKEHVEKCPHHPMSALKVENERLRAALKKAVDVMENEGNFHETTGFVMSRDILLGGRDAARAALGAQDEWA